MTVKDTLPEQAATATEPAPICVACVGDRTNPDGGPCLRCKGTGTDPDPLAPVSAGDPCPDCGATTYTRTPDGDDECRSCGALFPHNGPVRPWWPGGAR